MIYKESNDSKAFNKLDSARQKRVLIIKGVKIFKLYLVAISSIFLISCASNPSTYSFPKMNVDPCPELLNGISEISTDSTYGYDVNNPVKVGGGPSNERAYLNMLTDHSDLPLNYHRLGSTGGNSGVIIDHYQVKISGSIELKSIYIDMYNCETPKALYDLKIRSSAK